MKISIRKSLKIFFSERFNKANVAYFIAFSLLFYMPCIMYQNDKDPKHQAIAFLAGLIYSFLLGGYSVLTVNKLIKKKKSVVPGLADIPAVFLHGLKIYLAMTAAWIVIYIPAIILAVIGIILFVILHVEKVIALIIILSIICIIILFACFRYLIPAYLIYMHTLQLDSFFNFKRISRFMASRNQYYGQYLLKTIGISVFGVLFIFTAAFVFILLMTISGGNTPVDPSDKSLLSMIYILMFGWVFLFYGICTGLNSQFIMSADDSYLKEDNFDEYEDNYDDI